MPSRRPAPLRTWIAAAALAAGGCGDTLLDHAADPSLLGPVCAAPELACGGRCLACQAPADADPACSGGACDFTCHAGFNRCGGPGCVPESAASCGEACQDCAPLAPANALPVCTAAHACDFACAPGWLKSGGQCVRAASVSAGYNHTCALLQGGAVKCWGANYAGQLGDGSTADSAVPVDVAGLPGPASAVVAGYAHACAIVAGAAWCWGDNTFGEIGDGTTAPYRSTPVAVVGLGGTVVALGAGGGVLSSPVPTSFGHTCAILSGGALWCWGADGSGQLGDGGTSTRRTPAAVTALAAGTAVDAVACGERHTCALAAGAVTCWGANDEGQLGIGSNLPQGSPAAPAVASGATAIAAGLDHACAIVSGALECWGLNSSGQVNAGDGSQGTFTAPTAPALGGGFQPASLAGGRAHTCATEAGGTPKCFGANNAGQLGGAGSKVDATLVDLATAAAVTAGSDHSCALTTDGGVQCWGSNAFGQLGSAAPSPSGPAWVSGQ
jgi:alpha-tubulin suppressor-like RCC1 family protein